jgi:hypothetical protein
VTEPVPIERGGGGGEVIARGPASQLGETAIERLDFVVRTVRQHMWRRQCDHLGALFFCSKCGVEMTGLTLR